MSRNAVSAEGARAPSLSSVTFDRVSVDYRAQRVLHAFSLDVAAGEFVALIGPSGSGKTTALRALAGFARPSEGRVLIGGRDITNTPPYERGLGLVVQNYALFPHMSVADNVAFGLRARGDDSASTAKRVGECLALVGMDSFAERLPRQLSGGQQQRVAIARALAVRPKVLLLDEPLSALDAQIRRSMVEELARLRRDLPDVTTLYVTHDQSEALTLADRIGILKDGRMAALGPAEDLYRRPPNRFAAEFLGRANLLHVSVIGPSRPGFVHVGFGAKRFEAAAPETAQSGEALLCVRPHALKIAADGASISNGNIFDVNVQSALWQGDRIDLTALSEGQAVRLAADPGGAPPTIGQALTLTFDSAHATLVPLGGP